MVRLTIPNVGLILFAIVSASFLEVSAARAQSDTAVLSGRITDQSGDVLPGTQVSLVNLDTNGSVSAPANDDGIYVARNLHPGRYRVLVEKTGFKSIVLDNLVVAVQDVLGRNFTMEIGQVTDVVTVTGNRDGQNLSPAVGTVVDRQFVDQMPLNGRSFQSLIQLTPGILVSPAGQGVEGQFTVNGQRSNANYFTVDGVSVNFGTNISVNLGQNLGGTLPGLTISGGTNSFVSVDAMQEFRTLTSTYSAEFGRSPGAQVAIVTKSGGNEIHGTLYDYVRHEALDARNWYNPPPEPEPPLRQQNFGGTLGGPIRKNRSFFFLSYEGLRLRQPQTVTANFYTPETRAAVAPVYQPFVQRLPIPTGPLQDPSCDNVSRPCIASLTASFSDPTRFDAYSLRVDQTLKERFTMFVRASHTPSVTENRVFAGVESSSLNTDLVTTGVTAVLTSHLLNDLRLGWGRSTGTIENSPDETHGPTPSSIDSLFLPGQAAERNQVAILFPNDSGVSAGTRAANVARQLNVVDTFSVVAGTHQLKFGVDYRYVQATSQGTTGYLLQLLDFNQVRSGTMGAVLWSASEPLTARTHNSSLFAQDTWKVAPRLTAVYGVRWEINTPPVSADPARPLYAIQGIFDSKPLQAAPAGTPLWRTRFDDIGPRFGVAFEARQGTILRGGFGIFHDIGYGRLLGSLMFGFPYNRLRVTSVSGQPFDLANPAFTPPPITPSLSAVTQGGIAAFDPQLRLPSTRQWNAAVEHALGTNQSVSATYVGAAGVDLLRADFVVPPELRVSGGPPIAVTRNAGASRYHALQTQFQRRLHDGLQALVSYTLATARDTESDDGGGNFSGAALNANSATSVSRIYVPALAPADFDVRHAFSAAVSYEVPTPDWGSIGRAILRDWGVDVLTRISSPRPINVRIQGTSPELGNYNTQPDLAPGEPIWLAAPGEPGGQIVNPAAFTLPPAGAPGNFPRNSIRSPFGINQTDLALRRRFPIAGVSLEFRVDVFNLFNRAMFLGPEQRWGRCTTATCAGQQSPFFGKVADGTLNVALGGGGLNGGQSAIYAVGGPRSGQLSLKMRF